MSNDELMRQLQRIIALYRRGIPSSGDSNAMDPAQSSCLHGTGRILSKLVHQGDGLTQAALAEKLNIRPQSLSEALSKMEERGWIRRCPNPQDKRGTLVYLTEEGRAQEERLAEKRRCTADALLSTLNDAEKETLAALLEKILESGK